MTYRSLLAAGLLAALCAAPANAQNRQELQMLADLRMVQQQLARLQLAVNGLVEQVQAADARVDGQRDATIKGFADIGVLVNQLTTDLSTLRENLYDNTTRVAKLSQEVDAIRQGIASTNGLLGEIIQLLSPPPVPADLDPNAVPPTPPGDPTNPPAPPAVSPPTSTLPTAPRLPPSPRAYYNQASGFYAAGQFDLAIEAYGDFLSQFPSSPDAAEAQFFIGESYYQTGRYQEALVAFASVVANYAGSEHIPNAYYRQGLCYEQIGQRAEAVKNYQLLRTNYPETIASVNATNALIRLGEIKDGGL